RAQFLDALRQIAEYNDRSGNAAGPAALLADALLALEEADDFVAAPTGRQPMRTAAIVAAHRSSAARTLPAGATPMQAASHYGQSAAHRLAAALGPSRDASMALFGLGRVHVMMLQEPSVAI